MSKKTEAKGSSDTQLATIIALLRELNETNRQILHVLGNPPPEQPLSKIAGHLFSGTGILSNPTLTGGGDPPPSSVKGLNKDDTNGLRHKFVGNKKGPAVSEQHIEGRNSAFLWWKFNFNPDLKPWDTKFPSRITDALPGYRGTLVDEYFNDVACTVTESDLTKATTFNEFCKIIGDHIRAAHKLP